MRVQQFENRFKDGATYSGADMIVFMAFPNHKPIEIGSVTTVSYTTYREKKQVRTLGRISAKGFTKAGRTISGRMIFTVIYEHIVESLRKEIPYLSEHSHILMDELPPFDLVVSFGNEYGGSAGLIIQGVTTVDEQKTMSVEELFTENIFTYIARRIEPMKDTSNITENKWNPLDHISTSFRGQNERLGKFKIDELALNDFIERMEDYNPFIELGDRSGGQYSPMSFDFSKAYKDKKNFVDLLKTPTLDPVKTQAPPTLSQDMLKGAILYVYIQSIENKSPITGASVVDTTGADGPRVKASSVSNQKGVAKLDQYKIGDKALFTVKAKGFEERMEVINITKREQYITIYLDPIPNESDQYENRHYVDKVYGIGDWVTKHHADKHYIPVIKNSQFISAIPRPSVRVENSYGERMDGIKVKWSYDIKNWDDVKPGIIQIGYAGKVKTKTGEIAMSTTDSIGMAKMPEFDFYKFPKEARVVITATAYKYKGASGSDISTKKTKFHFDTSR